MRRKIMSIISIISLISLVHTATPVMAAETFNWYCRHMKNGETPECDPQMKFVEKYDSYYIDRKAGNENKTVYLTFDAGYENGNVEKILDVLKEKNVAGAFFILLTVSVFYLQNS